MTAHEALENFELQIDAGLTYGDMMADWPAVSATVIANLDVIDVIFDEDFPESEITDSLAYSLGIARAHDAWAETVDAVRGFIRDDESESAITTKYSAADRSMNGLDDLQDAALSPGDSSEEG